MRAPDRARGDVNHPLEFLERARGFQHIDRAQEIDFDDAGRFSLFAFSARCDNCGMNDLSNSMLLRDVLHLVLICNVTADKGDMPGRAAEHRHEVSIGLHEIVRNNLFAAPGEAADDVTWHPSVAASHERCHVQYQLSRTRVVAMPGIITVSRPARLPRAKEVIINAAFLNVAWIKER